MGSEMCIRDRFYYRQLAYLSSSEELSKIKEEMSERFGEAPKEVEHLYNITELRIICKQLKIEKFDIGNKGLTIKFKNNHFEKTDQLVEFMSQYKYDLKLRSDQTLVYNYQKTSNKDRIYKAFSFAKELQAL